MHDAIESPKKDGFYLVGKAVGSFNNQASQSNNSYYDASSFIAFTDNNGKLIWSKLFGGGSFEEIYSVKI